MIAHDSYIITAISFQVLDATIPIDSNFLAQCTPLPQLVPKLMALFYPFEVLVWIFIAISLFAVAGSFYVISIFEGGMTNQPLPEWSTVRNAICYAYGTLMGEAITRDTRSEKAMALRHDSL